MSLHKITPGIVGAGRVNTEFVWTDEVRVQDELARLYEVIRALEAENKALREQCAKLSASAADRA